MDSILVSIDVYANKKSFSKPSYKRPMRIDYFCNDTIEWIQVLTFQTIICKVHACYTYVLDKLDLLDLFIFVSVNNNRCSGAPVWSAQRPGRLQAGRTLGMENCRRNRLCRHDLLSGGCWFPGMNRREAQFKMMETNLLLVLLFPLQMTLYLIGSN